MKTNQLEQRVITSMRLAIANLDGDSFLAREGRSDAHRLFGDHLMEWSDAFADLYNQMLRIVDAHTPRARGHHETKHIAMGYSSLPISVWVADKEQPPVPTSQELLVRFDQAIRQFENGGRGGR